MIIKKLIYPTIFILFLVSCSQESGPLLSTEEVGLETVEDGTFLIPGESVSVVLTEIGSRVTLVRMTLKDEAGTVVADADLDPEMLKGLGLPMDLPQDISDGVYYLHFEVLEGRAVIYEEDRYIFVVSGEYKITSLETFPPGIKPGDEISARISLSTAGDADPWIRWSLDDGLIREGLYSEVGLACLFEVPDEAGVYTLKVELFPKEPGNDMDSTVFRHTDLFVTSGDGDDEPWKFIEDRTYQYFIDFSEGTSNKMNPEDVPQVIGSPKPYSQGSYKGISFGVDDGLIFNQYALPLSPEGRAKDFLLTMAFSYSSLPEEGTYNVFRTGDGNAYFSVLYLAETREFMSEFRSYSRYFHSSVSVDDIHSSEAVSLEVNYTAGQGVASLSWKNDGRTISHDEGAPVSSLVEGKTYIGKDGTLQGFPMNWYTLGVSTQEGPQNSQAVQNISAGPGRIVNLYEKSQKPADLIAVDNVELGEGLSTLEIQCEPDRTGSWSFVLKDSTGEALYTMVADGGSDGRDRIILSLSNDHRGLFLSTSLDTDMNGPFDYQKSLNFEISPESGVSETLEDILTIRLYRN